MRIYEAHSRGSTCTARENRHRRIREQRGRFEAERGWEFEQWVTFRKGYLEGNRQFDQFLWDFREEIEHGFTDKLSGAMYLNFQQEQIVAQEPGLGDSSKFSFKGVSAEVKYQLLNPFNDPIGIALYFEPTRHDAFLGEPAVDA